MNLRRESNGWWGECEKRAQRQSSGAPYHSVVATACGYALRTHIPVMRFRRGGTLTIPRGALAVALGFAAVAVPSVGGAQAVLWDLVGIVRETSGKAIAGAVIEIGVVSARTDSLGRFRIQATRRDSLTLVVRRLGFVPVSAFLTAPELQGDTLLVLMDANAQMLESVSVKARDLRSALGYGSFEERRAQGLGVYVTREEIVKRNTLRLSDVVRMQRGVHLVRLSNGVYGVRFTAFEGRQRSCAPEIWVDGQRLRGMEIDDVPANTVEAIELYRSTTTTPFQFTVADGASGPRCGTIVIWSRAPGTP